MDLNVLIGLEGKIDSDAIIREKLMRCKSLGYRTVALATHVDLTEIQSHTPLNIPESLSKQHITTLLSGHKPPIVGLNVHTRLTARVSDTSQIFKLSKSGATSKYDLLAFEPTNDKILLYLSMGSADFDILTFDLNERLAFTLHKVRFRVLEKRGVCMEINYGPAQLGSSIRRNIICNGQNLVEKTVKTLVLSSGVADVFRLRSPKDAVSLGVLFMVPPKRCHDLVFKNGNKALDAAKCRKNPMSSAIELVAAGEIKRDAAPPPKCSPEAKRPNKKLKT